jgi:hypothetical protein
MRDYYQWSSFAAPELAPPGGQEMKPPGHLAVRKELKGKVAVAGDFRHIQCLEIEDFHYDSFV